MQNAKDTFYVMLQSRLASLNPARNMVVRGVLRPGILVEENELPGTFTPVDIFLLDWTELQIDHACPLPLVKMGCLIHYATDGSAGSGSMDRGRLLAAMDAELSTALGTEPHAVGKMNYSAAGSGVSSVAMGSNIFWADPQIGAAKAVGERLERSVTVQVFAYQEAGEL